jgi:hypothetical protein
VLRSPPWLGWSQWDICGTNDHGYVPLVINTSLSFPHAWLITGWTTRITRRVALVEKELLTLLEHLNSPLVLSGVRITRSLVLYVCFADRCHFVLFRLTIALSVHLRFTVSGYLCGIFKLFFLVIISFCTMMSRVHFNSYFYLHIDMYRCFCVVLYWGWLLARSFRVVVGCWFVI